MARDTVSRLAPIICAIISCVGRLLHRGRVALRAVEDEARHAARHVEQHEPGDLGVGVAQPARQLLEQRPRDARHALDLGRNSSRRSTKSAVLSVATTCALRGCPSMSASSPKCSVGPERAEDDLAPVDADDGHLHRARAHDVERVAGIALPHDEGAARIALLPHERGEDAALLGGEALEERDVGEELRDAGSEHGRNGADAGRTPQPSAVGYATLPVMGNTGRRS
jgi:hypothetical protein